MREGLGLMEHECYGYIDLFNISNNKNIKCHECGKELGT
jgi:hypothetical protein